MLDNQWVVDNNLNDLSLPKELSKEEWKEFYFLLQNFCNKVWERRKIMDTGKGYLRMLKENEKALLMSEEPNRTDIFTVGEEVTIRESRFRIAKITDKKITLRILPKPKS